MKSAVQHSVVEELMENQLTESVIQPGTVVYGSEETDVFSGGGAGDRFSQQIGKKFMPPTTTAGQEKQSRKKT